MAKKARVTLHEIVEAAKVETKDRDALLVGALHFFLVQNDVKVKSVRTRKDGILVVTTDATGEERLRDNFALPGKPGVGPKRRVEVPTMVATLERVGQADAFKVALRWTAFRAARVVRLLALAEKLAEAEKAADEILEAASDFASSETQLAMSPEGKAYLAVASAHRDVKWSIGDVTGDRSEAIKELEESKAASKARRRGRR